MRYVKAFDIWNPAILDLAMQGKLQVQSGQVVYRQNRSDVSIIDEIKKGHIRAFHGTSVKEARAKYMDYKRIQRIGEKRKQLLKQRKEIDQQIAELRDLI